MSKHVSPRRFAAVASIVLSVAGLALALPSTQAAESPPYVFNKADIPTRNGRAGLTSFTDINDSGTIMGSFTDSEAAPHGFVLNNKVKPSEIRCSKDVISTVPQAINKRGEIAGTATVIVDRIPIPVPPFETLVTKVSGFFRNSTGKCKILDFPGADLTEALGLNDARQVVGHYRDGSGTFHGFLWQAGSFVSYDVPVAGADGSALNQINNVGQSIGIYWDFAGTYGFLLDKGSFAVLPTVENALFTDATDINDRGQIAGNYVDGGGAIHGFVLQDGRFTTVDVPFDGVEHTVISGINNHGQLVGRYLTSDPDDPVNPFPSHGFIATPGTNAKLIKSLAKKFRDTGKPDAGADGESDFAALR